MKVTRKAKERFNYFVSCQDTKRLPAILFVPEGNTALECFFAHETYGQTLPTKEPELFSRALNGKERHGLTVTMVAEDYIGRLTFASELKENYPPWVRKDILGRAKQLSMQQLGWVPKFIETGEDFTTVKD